LRNEEAIDMKNFNIEDLKGMLSEIRNSEEKKNLYVLIGILVAVSAVAVGIAAIFIKKHMDEKEADDMYDDWDDCDDDYCNCGCDDESDSGSDNKESEEDK
jgi:hypothetical protein